MNWFLQSLQSNKPFLEVRRRFVIDTGKLKGYVRFKESAHASRMCGFCGVRLYDKRKIFCNSRCRRSFNRKFHYFVVTWRQVRYRTLRRDRWLCVKCGRRAREVDHIIPLALGGSEFNTDNCQSLCRSCHLRKTIQEIRERTERKTREKLDQIEIPILVE